MAIMDRKCLLVLAIGAFGQAAAWAQSVPLVGDAYFAIGNTNNFGGTVTVNVGGVNGNQGLFQFDLSLLPPGTTASSVSSASLRIYVDRIGVGGGINVYAANAPWLESGVTGAPNNFPGPGPLVAGPISVTVANTYVVIPVTNQVMSWLNGNPNDGFLVQATPSSSSLFFDSKEANPTSGGTSHQAVLEINLFGSAGTSGAQGVKGPTGVTGPTGPAGNLGAQGAAGSGAAPGSTGPIGNTGPAGLAGSTGITGQTGLTGFTGTTGAVGSAGAAGGGGPTGVTGATGTTGNAGAAGAVGSAGAQGPLGSTGPTGNTGNNGPAGNQGALGAAGNPGGAGPQGNVGNNGPNGNNGANGNTGVTGPTGTQGLIRNSFSLQTTPLAMSNTTESCGTGCVTPTPGSAPITADSTHNFFLVDNHPDNGGCVNDGLEPGFPDKGITLPSASGNAGTDITLIGIDFTVNGCYMVIFPASGQKIVFQDHVRPGETNSQGFNPNGLLTGFGARFISNGSGIWYGVDIF